MEELGSVDTILKKWDRRVWTGHLVQDRGRWWALVNMVMSFQVA
jgi:hypothetical protein